MEGSESSRERKFQGTFVPGSESSRERKFQGTSESSTLWNFRSWERKFLGTKVPAFKLGWRKFRRRISKFIATLAEFSPVIILLDGVNSASVGRMKMLQRRKIGRDLARIATLAQLIPAPSLPTLHVPLPSAFFWYRLISHSTTADLSQPSWLVGALWYSLINSVVTVLDRQNSVGFGRYYGKKPRFRFRFRFWELSLNN